MPAGAGSSPRAARPRARGWAHRGVAFGARALASFWRQAARVSGGLTREEFPARMLAGDQAAPCDGGYHARRSHEAVTSRVCAFLKRLLPGSRARPAIRL